MTALNPAALAEIKATQHTRISVCLPARDEEATVGHIVATVRRNLVERVPLVDEIVVVDDGSKDATAEAARWEGATVHAAADILPDAGPGFGKGNALWLSLFAATGDLICWVDADVRNFRADFVTRLVEPLLVEPDVGFVKGYYRRPLFGRPTGGGRVTELVARPLLSSLFPQLTHIVQPLGGEYAGRRSLLETVPFVEGYGVELGLLIDIATSFGVGTIRQADLGVREHRNRPIEELAPMAMEVMLTALRRAGVNRGDVPATLVRFDENHERTLLPVEARERPPIISIPAYRTKLGRELTA
ncbi:MAG: glucosyl-3-phosphoglycerate synthase [Acidimicrobiia bacterium]